MAMPVLAEFQARMAAALLLPHSALGESSRPTLSDSLEAGFSVYRNTIAKGLIDALRANYPTVERLVGAQCFDAVSHDFIRQQPPPEPTLALYGEAFADCLLELGQVHGLAYLPFVAHLDRLWLEAYFAVDAPSLCAQQLRRVSGELTTVRVRLHAAARIARLPHSALTIWRNNHPPATPPATLEVTGAAECVLLSRPRGAVEVHELSHAEYAFLQQIDLGSNLGEAVVYVMQQHAEADIAAMLATFIGAGAFAAEIYLD